ncbi:hypothetical protein HD806DRAFT_537728 [Xylariaceae sp. AK1471]|nr:hypothetical protein HD806DRAFT_537728 [Xylariaceae sp. AK1471]
MSSSFFRNLNRRRHIDLSPENYEARPVAQDTRQRASNRASEQPSSAAFQTTLPSPRHRSRRAEAHARRLIGTTASTSSAAQIPLPSLVQQDSATNNIDPRVSSILNYNWEHTSGEALGRQLYVGEVDDELETYSQQSSIPQAMVNFLKEDQLSAPIISMPQSTGDASACRLNQNLSPLIDEGNNFPHHNRPQSPRLWIFILDEYGTHIIAQVDERISNSSIYYDTLENGFAGEGWQRLMRPWPRNHLTMTSAGYHPYKAQYIVLAIKRQTTPRERAEQAVKLRLNVIPRRPEDNPDVQAVLGQDYLQTVNTPNNRIMDTGQLEQKQAVPNILLNDMAGHLTTEPGVFSPSVGSSSVPNYVSPQLSADGMSMPGLPPGQQGKMAYTYTQLSSPAYSGPEFSAATSQGYISSMGNTSFDQVLVVASELQPTNLPRQIKFPTDPIL